MEDVDNGINTHETLIKVKEKLDKKKQRKWLPLKTNRAYLLRPVCSETRRGKLCTKGLNHSCTTETMQTILDSTSFNTGEANFISIDDKVSDKNKDISLIRGKFSSATNLPTYIKSGVQLGNFPGDSKNAFKRKTIRRNAVPTVEYEPDIYYDSDDSSKVSDLPEDDLERGSAIVAAFVVTLITIWFFGTMISMIFITMSVSGDYQGRIITYNLCKNFPDWSLIIVNDSPGSSTVTSSSVCSALASLQTTILISTPHWMSILLCQLQCWVASLRVHYKRKITKVLIICLFQKCKNNKF